VAQLHMQKILLEFRLYSYRGYICVIYFAYLLTFYCINKIALITEDIYV
jgi:hypothetical protein